MAERSLPIPAIHIAAQICGRCAVVDRREDAIALGEYQPRLAGEGVECGDDIDVAVDVGSLQRNMRAVPPSNCDQLAPPPVLRHRANVDFEP